MTMAEATDTATPDLSYIHPELRHLAVPIDSLVLDPKNARRHDEGNQKRVYDSLKRFGQRLPIVVQKQGMIIRVGNNRTTQAKKLGWTHVAALVVEESDVEAMAFALVDNQATEGSSWDPEVLSSNMREIQAMLESTQYDNEDDAPFQLDELGWSSDELDVLVSDLGDTSTTTTTTPTNTEEPEGLNDDIPETPADPVTQVGEVLNLGRHRLHCGDCIAIMSTMPDNSVDAIVTDPPYGIGFMNRGWDNAVPGDTFAEQAFRVLKPGGHIIAFAATRTVHRLAVALEDAGFEIRDQISWLQWQGFPKSLNVSKAIDKLKGNRDEILKVTKWLAAARDAAGKSNADIDAHFGFVGMAGHWCSKNSQPQVPTIEQWQELLAFLGAEPPEKIAELCERLIREKGEPGENWFKRESTGEYEDASPGRLWRERWMGVASDGDDRAKRDIPATPEAAQWQGWGSCLKPCQEPAVLARKPTEARMSIAENVLKWGTGALNIDACRMPKDDPRWPGPSNDLSSIPQPEFDSDEPGTSLGFASGTGRNGETFAAHPLGLWPANIIVVPKASTAEREAGLEDADLPAKRWTDGRKASADHPKLRDKKDRKNYHPTVKPVRLMRWLLQLVTPPGGVVLEPFAGSGSTLVGALGLDLSIVACEMDPAYCDIIRARVKE